LVQPGYSKKITDDIPGAILAIQKLCSWTPNITKPISTGEYLLRPGEYRKAVDDYTIALKQGPILYWQYKVGRIHIMHWADYHTTAIPDYEKLYAWWPDKLCACGTFGAIVL